MLTIFGGIGLFLLGMTMLTGGLKEIAGDALKRWLNTFTKGRISAVVSGAVMTMLVQSSTATTILTIGFVSAGLLSFFQSIGIIIGANIGSTSTGWIISLIGFKISLQTMALPMIGTGVFLSFLASRNIKKFGNVVTGFGLLFLGIDMLQQGMGAAQNFISFDAIPVGSFLSVVLLISIGIGMTVIMQASSAAMAATLTALFAGAIDFEQAAYLVIGQNIGTTATALFASIGASVAAKRTAMTHLLFNVLTAAIVTVAFSSVIWLTKWTTTLMTGAFDEPLGLAVFHTLFSLLGALVFIPFMQPFAALLKRIIPERENALTRNLDSNLVTMPSVAIEVTFKTLREIMIELTKAQQMLMRLKKVTAEFERKVLGIEEALERTRKFLDGILTASQRERRKLLSLLHTLDHLHRLIRVLREPLSVEALSLQEKRMREWQGMLSTIDQRLSKDEKLLDISVILQETSRQMAQKRRDKRVQYFERSVANETQFDVAVSKVDTILWIDRLIYHYWRATARMAEYQTINEE